MREQLLKALETLKAKTGEMKRDELKKKYAHRLSPPVDESSVPPVGEEDKHEKIEGAGNEEGDGEKEPSADILAKILEALEHEKEEEA